MNPQRIMDLACAFYDACVLFRAVEAGVFAHLAQTGPAGAAGVASACRLNPRAARLLLDACAALELVEKDGDTYRNSPEAETFLVPGSPADLSGALAYNRDVYPLWGRLDEFLKTGRPVERPEVHLGGDPERTRAFVMAMHSRALAIGRAVVPLLSLQGTERILDVGGGSGAYSILAARDHDGVRATVMDLPEIVKVAAEQVQAAGLAARIDCVPGDYHRADFPPEQDLILLFGMLHQESPETIQHILEKAHRALRPGGRIAVLDMMTDASRCRPKFSALFALNMALTAEHGWVFSDQDLEGWCTAAGLTDFVCRPLPPPMPHWLAIMRKSS